jgi:glycosyltransferase involved in cell wall biosynthesis
VRVLVTADAVGGVYAYAAELARGLAARGVEVALAVAGAPTRDQLAVLEGLRGLSVHARPFRLEWMEDPWDDVAAAGEWLLSLERLERPDVVHLDSYAHAALAFRAPKVVVAHSCVCSWWEAVRGGPAPATWDRYRAAVRSGLDGADAVVAPTAAMLAALERHHGPVRSGQVVPNGRDAARFPPAEKEDLVLGAGRLWDEAKNAAALVRIAPRLRWPVAVAGAVAPPGADGQREAAAAATGGTAGAGHHPSSNDPGSFTGVRHRASGYRTGEPARLLGHLPERALARWLGRAGIYAHPARYEPFGLGVLEAALAGCALVLGDVDSLRESWDGAALFAPPGDDEAIAAAIEGLAADGVRRRTLAARARARALGLGPDRTAAGYLALYRELLARRRRAARPAR